MVHREEITEISSKGFTKISSKMSMFLKYTGFHMDSNMCKPLMCQPNINILKKNKKKGHANVMLN